MNAVICITAQNSFAPDGRVSYLTTNTIFVLQWHKRAVVDGMRVRWVGSLHSLLHNCVEKLTQHIFYLMLLTSNLMRFFWVWREYICNKNALSKTVTVEINISCVLYIMVLRGDSQCSLLQCYKIAVLTHFILSLFNRTTEKEVLSIWGRRWGALRVVNFFREVIGYICHFEVM